MIRAIMQRSGSRTFRRSFALILAAEAVTIGVAWLLLGANTSEWIHEQTARLAQISEQAASSADWSRLGAISNSSSSSLDETYGRQLDKLSRPFSNKEGAVYAVIVQNGEAYELYADGNPPTDVGKPPQWERDAYATRKTTYTPVPYSDDTGTYLAAFTPIVHNGSVVGLIAAELDSATLAEFQGIVRTTFWLSIVPAVLASLLVAYILASMLVEPMDVFRTIEETARSQRALSPSGEEGDRWDRLTPKHKEVAELARQGLTNKEIADALSVSYETVKQHFKDVRERTGWSKVDLAVQAQARRTASLPL
jgi:DNA-binding CsgD family transcriptional regulator